ncbi:MAG: hypothetical protein K9G58_14690 [Bacteroidales bacterium]|nr:hypothetical protein [Bacteroidales bacterium]MCF8387898.1 hypothetical protein [Bacteroidales bacterium]MCF8399419.1 hypothetical protein [Bacteroidales bacterium]
MVLFIYDAAIHSAAIYNSKFQMLGSNQLHKSGQMTDVFVKRIVAQVEQKSINKIRIWVETLGDLVDHKPHAKALGKYSVLIIILL